MTDRENPKPNTAAAVALATGSVSGLPDITGLVHAAPWGAREATSADHVTHLGSS